MVALVAVAALLVAGWWWLGGADEPAAGFEQAATASASGARDPSPAAPGERAPSPAQITRPATAPSESAPDAPPAVAPPRAARVGSLQVEVFDAAGAPLAELPVHLARGGSATLEERTDLSGRASFPALEAGAWAIRVGGAERPLVAERAVQLAADAALRERIEIPFALVELDVQVTDDAGRPAPNVALRARCDRGGEPHGVTDHAGRATLRFVPPGVVRVFAQDEHLGRGNQVLEVGAPERAPERAQVQISLRRRS